MPVYLHHQHYHHNYYCYLVNTVQKIARWIKKRGKVVILNGLATACLTPIKIKPGLQEDKCEIYTMHDGKKS